MLGILYLKLCQEIGIPGSKKAETGTPATSLKWTGGRAGVPSFGDTGVVVTRISPSSPPNTLPLASVLQGNPSQVLQGLQRPWGKQHQHRTATMQSAGRAAHKREQMELEQRILMATQQLRRTADGSWPPSLVIFGANKSAVGDENAIARRVFVQFHRRRWKDPSPSTGLGRVHVEQVGGVVCEKVNAMLGPLHACRTVRRARHVQRACNCAALLRDLGFVSEQNKLAFPQQCVDAVAVVND
uniref:Uncharacterized protein n=1 Tax=Globodera rostochiensis TaxID=31243 RepID=A0A914HTQ5_GLORO